jgi:hypothetical protein
MSDKLRHLFTAAEAEVWLGIPAGTVRAWASRERVFSFGLDERNRPMYDRDHLVALRDSSRRKAAAA